jgi:hypothetical protein
MTDPAVKWLMEQAENRARRARWAQDRGLYNLRDEHQEAAFVIRMLARNYAKHLGSVSEGNGECTPLQDDDSQIDGDCGRGVSG